MTTTSPCTCEICRAGGDCCGTPVAMSVGHLLEQVYDETYPVAQVAPKDRMVALKAAMALVERLRGDLSVDDVRALVRGWVVAPAEAA